jgi:hypothetical protein
LPVIRKKKCKFKNEKFYIRGLPFTINYLNTLNVIEQVNSFNYLGNMVSCDKELDIDNKLHNYFKITGILSNVFRPQKTLRKQK